MPLNSQKALIFEKLGYKPSKEQNVIHEDPARFKLVAGGERSGKSVLSAKEYMGRFWETPLLWLLAADYQRTTAEFQYIQEDFNKLGIPFEASKRVDPGEIHAQGGFKIETRSGQDPRKIASIAPDGIIICEGSQIDYETFLRARGRLAEKRGWMVIGGTFETSLGWYPELYTRWQLPNKDEGKSFSLPTWSNKAIFPGGRTDPEILALEAAYPPDLFLERFGGIPCPPTGRVLTEFANSLHVGFGGNYEFDPKKPCYLWVDPGYATAYAVEVVQLINDHVWVVDEIFERNLVTSEIIKICKQKPWWNKVDEGVIDVAAEQHQAMPAPTEIWAKEAGLKMQSQKVKILDGIERLKTFLIVNPVDNQPRFHINVKCRGLISELGGCENPITGQSGVYSWRKDKEGHIVGEVPDDKNNHGIKAVTYGLINRFGYTQRLNRNKIRFF